MEQWGEGLKTRRKERENMGPQMKPHDRQVIFVTKIMKSWQVLEG